MGLDFALIKQSALPLLSNTPPPQKKKKIRKQQNTNE
jgi:hypothetical protein